MRSVEENFKKYGIGIKSKKRKLTKDEITRLALLRNPKADPKILRELELIK
jgi:hypothetical protein